jgi:hypothetical protein
MAYTHARELADHTSWYGGAVSYHEAAIILYEAKDRIHAGFRVFAFNAALSLELIIKAVLTAESKPFPKKHALRLLADLAQLQLSPDQLLTLDLLSEVLIWRGKYPTPILAKQWDNFHVSILEPHLVRSQSGNVSTTAVNGQTFPSKENYVRIWNICKTRYSHED